MQHYLLFLHILHCTFGRPIDLLTTPDFSHVGQHTILNNTKLYNKHFK